MSNYERGQRRIDVLDFLRIVDVLEGDARAVFTDIVARPQPDEPQAKMLYARASKLETSPDKANYRRTLRLLDPLRFLIAPRPIVD